MANVETNLNEIGDGRLVKMEVDYCNQVDNLVPEAEKMAKAGKLSEALDKLYVMEKQTRLGADMRSNGRVLEAMIRLCFENQQWTMLNETITALSKKRSLIKQAVSKMVQLACTYVDKMPSDELRLKLIDTLRTVTAGKIYVEVERARLTYELVKWKEAHSELDEAAKLLLELQVETYGTMEHKEKVEYLLEQMRLTLAKKDFIRASIISKKISTKFFEKDDIEIQKMKLRYYKHMITLDQNESNYLNICRHYRAVCDTPLIKDDTARLDDALKCVVLYVLLAPYGNEQWDLLNRIKADKQLQRLPLYLELLELMSTEELISWRDTIETKYARVLRPTAGANQASAVDADAAVFDGDAGQQRWNDFQTRILEHNIRCIAKYYDEIPLRRMSELLDWPRKPDQAAIDQTEDFVCKLVTGGSVSAKIDRPAGVVSFRQHDRPSTIADQWTSNLNKLTEHLNKVHHLMLKEEMVHTHLHVHGDRKK